MTDTVDLDDLRHHLTAAEFSEFEKLAAVELKKRVFYPTDKQQQVLDSEADIIGFGGAAGGGKSYLVTGLAVSRHKRSSITRPQKNQTIKFVEELAKMLETRDGYSSQTSSWKFDAEGAERYIHFFGLDNPGDQEKQQGDDYDLKCVGAGTLVWMADGSRKPVEQVQCGDMVQTLDGARAVTRTIRQTKAAVLVKTSSGSQVQGSTHQLLGPSGWQAHAQLHLCAGGDQRDQHQPDDAERRSPIYLLEDEARQTPRRRRSRRRWSYAHPYTKERRTTDCLVRVEDVEHFDVGVCALYDLTIEGANHYVTQQGFINRNCYDEATQMREADIRYTLTWNRTDDPKQKVRAILTFNPPTTAEGRWVIKFFAPWLDKNHPNPAKEGELRWFATIGDNQDYEVPSGDPFVIVNDEHGNPKPHYWFEPMEHRPEEIVTPKSRTFIRSLVTDNPYYMRSGYMKQLQALPEPLRSQMMYGDFEAGVEDDAKQLIPTAWIDAAMARWKVRNEAYKITPSLRGPMDSMGVDVARGGNMGSTLGALGHDRLAIAPRYGTFFGELKMHKGVAIDDGAKSAGLVIIERRDDAPVHVDVVGVGTSTYDFLKANNIQSIPVNGAAAAFGTASGGLRFFNLRAELHWRLREALDPSNPDPIALPFDPELAVDLASPRWELTKSGIKVEGKDDIKKRLGRSPDKGDAIVYANIDSPKRRMVVGEFLNLPAEMRNNGMSYEERRLKELE